MLAEIAEKERKAKEERAKKYGDSHAKQGRSLFGGSGNKNPGLFKRNDREDRGERRDNHKGGFWNSGGDRRNDRRDYNNDVDRRLADRFGNEFDDGKGRTLKNSNHTTGGSKASGGGRSFGSGWK